MEDHSPHLDEGCLKLYVAIIQRAIDDATSTDILANPESAKRFISADNKQFCDYCYWLGYDPEYAAKQFQNEILRFEALQLVRTILKVEKFKRGLLVCPKKIINRSLVKRRAYGRARKKS